MRAGCQPQWCAYGGLQITGRDEKCMETEEEPMHFSVSPESRSRLEKVRLPRVCSAQPCALGLACGQLMKWADAIS